MIHSTVEAPNLEATVFCMTSVSDILCSSQYCFISLQFVGIHICTALPKVLTTVFKHLRSRLYMASHLITAFGRLMDLMVPRSCKLTQIELFA